jgi:hypothetical protein
MAVNRLGLRRTVHGHCVVVQTMTAMNDMDNGDLDHAELVKSVNGLAKQESVAAK